MPKLVPPSPGLPYATIVAQPGETPAALAEADFVYLYKTHGAMLFRGFDVDMAGFRALTSAYCSASVFNESPDRKLYDAEHNIQSVNGGQEAFPLHPELSREPWKPDICFFWCMSPPGQGGETIVCDGVELVKQMPAAVRETFASHRLRYVLPASPEACAFWLGSPAPDDATLANPPPTCPYAFMRANGRILRVFTRPALHKPMFTDELAFGNFLLFARYHNNRYDFPVFDSGDIVPAPLTDVVRDIGARLSAPIAWQAGDIIVLDNTRFMHGRNAITNTDERQIATFFGYLNFAVPNAEEPMNAPWRRAAFRPPTRARA